MTGTEKYPQEWLRRVPALVFCSLKAGEIRLLLHPQSGLADGGAPRDVPVELVPVSLRMPNTALWAELDDALNVVRVCARD
jgi:hypothetical protein